MLCHSNQLNFTIDWEIGTSEKCHCNQMAPYCVTVTGVTVIGVTVTCVTVTSVTVTSFTVTGLTVTGVTVTN